MRVQVAGAVAVALAVALVEAPCAQPLDALPSFPTDTRCCRRGRLSRIGDVFTVVGGAIVGGLVAVIFSSDASLALVLAAAALGAVLANAIRHAMGPHV